MSKSAGFPRRVADLFRQNRLPAQVTGLALAVGGFAGLWWLAPSNRAAQLSAPLLGVALIFFTQFFHVLRKIKPEERRSLEAVAACCFGVCLLATLGATGYHYHRGAGRSLHDGGSVAVSGGGVPDTEVSFASDEPNRLVIRVPLKKPRKVVVEVQKVWDLTPSQPGPNTVDWPHPIDVKLSPTKSTPYKEETLSGAAVPIEVVLQPDAPETSAEPVQVGQGWATRLTLGKQAKEKDHVFLLRIEVADAHRNVVSAGSVLYLPDLKTGYGAPTGANQEALREIGALQVPKSVKLTDLLSGHPRSAEPQKPEPAKTEPPKNEPPNNEPPKKSPPPAVPPAKAAKSKT